MNRHVPPPSAIRCSVNGKDVSLKAAPQERLSSVLRAELEIEHADDRAGDGDRNGRAARRADHQHRLAARIEHDRRRH